MLALTLLLSLAPAPQGASAPVVINEFQYDDSGTDDREFVELYNATKNPIDISGWKLDSADQVGPNTAYTIPASTILAPGGFWVLGSALVPNVNQVVGATNLWENDQESLTLRDAGGAIVDTLVYEANKGYWDPTLAENDGVWGNMTSVDGVETSWSRLRDGLDTGYNGHDFRLAPATPGRSNNLAPGTYSEDYDAKTVGSTLAEFGSSFKPAVVIDPTVVDTNNPNAIPVSPQGGNAAIFWDNAGGGNANMFLADVGQDFRVEAWVYFDAKPEVIAGQRETWALGVGSGDTFFNDPDPSGALGGLTANGNVGVSWIYQVTDSSATLYLVDHNDGGWGAGAKTGATVLGQVSLTQGINDGWQRLLLAVDAGNVTGRFGGTYGGSDGTLITGAVRPVLGGVHVGYREFVTDNTTLRPFTVDRWSITCPDDPVVGFYGTTTSLSNGRTPDIGFSGLPSLGTANNVTGANLLPNSSVFVLIGLQRAVPLDLGAIGGPPGSKIWVDILLAPAVPTSPTGTSSFTQPIPNDPAICGILIAYQHLQLDPALGGLLPFAHSRGMTLTIGR